MFRSKVNWGVDVESFDPPSPKWPADHLTRVVCQCAAVRKQRRPMRRPMRQRCDDASGPSPTTNGWCIPISTWAALHHHRFRSTGWNLETATFRYKNLDLEKEGHGFGSFCPAESGWKKRSTAFSRQRRPEKDSKGIPTMHNAQTCANPAAAPRPFPATRSVCGRQIGEDKQPNSIFFTRRWFQLSRRYWELTIYIRPIIPLYHHVCL
jgi:hypothetical protein